MPGNRPGRGVYVDAPSALVHDQPAKVKNFVGVTVKQKGVNWDKGLTDQAKIAEGEQIFLITKGKVLVDAVEGAAKGDALYITGEFALTETKGENTPFGRVTEVAGERGTPTGKMWVDLDSKDSL